MLQTISGKAIPPEILLRILECMDYTPGLIENITGTCKTFQILVGQYEYSLSQKLAASLYPSTRQWISTPKRLSLRRSTYPWLHELYARATTITLLRTGPLLSSDHYRLSALAKVNLYLRERILSMLYDFSDLGSPSEEILGRNGVREAQETWIESAERSQKDLAIIYGMLTIISDNWRIALKSRVQSNGSSAKDFACSDSPIEEDCVYRECCLKYGPYFMKASLGCNESDSTWFEKVMDEGIRELRSFEAGEVADCRSSLQGLIFRRFCREIGCGSMNGWQIMWKVIDSIRVQ